ncbi:MULTISPECIES: hypothetical protein [Saccharothrix]|uniref:hypothetical protein n=1 Tax=Saccharothrix TaxID=2071 RepID=UPI00093DC600|nr:hypothetical protein [Saccharothrix sp. CB00851]
MEQDGRPVTANHVGGDVLGPSVQAGVIEGDVHLHFGGPPIGRPGELPVGVLSLMSAQVRAARELPYRLPGARRPSLATVYVRQELSMGAEEPHAQSRPTPILDGHGRLVELPRGCRRRWWGSCGRWSASRARRTVIGWSSGTR